MGTAVTNLKILSFMTAWLRTSLVGGALLLAPLLVAAQPASLCVDLLNAGKGSGVVEAQNNLVINSISGRLQIFQEAGKAPVGYFIDKNEVGAVRNMGSGDRLINSLSSFANTNDPTSLRVEEKIVAKYNLFLNYLDRSQTPDFISSDIGANQILWQARDVAPEGKIFTTITEYGTPLVFRLSSNSASFVVKPRYRKYFASSKADPNTNIEAVFNDLVAVELKITSAKGPNDHSFLGIDDTVFKPRIFVTNEIADALKLIDGSEAQYQELLDIETAVLSMKDSSGSLVNNSAQVRSFFAALSILVEKDAHFMRPVFSVKYNRDSYKASIDGHEYQLTADRNIKIFKASSNIKASQMQSYFHREPLFASADDEAFVELKSPVADRLNSKPAYMALMRQLSSMHLVSYQRGKGKYSIARYVDQGVRDVHIDRTLFDQGTKYWLIKGTGNLDSTPKKNDILMRGRFGLAFPFNASANEVMRLVLNYKQVNRLDGNQIAVLDGIQVVNRLGAKVKMDEDFDKLVEDVQQGIAGDIIAIEAGGSLVPIKPIISTEEFAEYKKFFLDFFEYDTHFFSRKPRSLSVSMSKNNNSGSLRLYSLKTRIDNSLHFLMDRLKRVTIGSLLTVAAIAAYDQYRAVDISQPQPVVESRVQAAGDLYLKGLYSKQGQITLIAKPHDQEHYRYYLPPSSNIQLKLNQNIELMDKEGNSIFFKVMKDKRSRLYLSLQV